MAPTMPAAVSFPSEDRSNATRERIHNTEPIAMRTFTPSQAVIAKSAGVFHWTPEGRRLYDYTSGVLVANLGHNPQRWQRRFCDVLGWDPQSWATGDGYFEASPLTAYNALTDLEAEANARLLKNLHASVGGDRMESVLWAASGSEAVQKALWCCMKRDPERDIIIATRHGFHGKKGLAGAVTGHEQSPERDHRVRFVSFPMCEIVDQSLCDESLDLSYYEAELEALRRAHGHRLGCLITEPYLGGGGSFHPPKAYLQMLQNFCREHDILFVLDEVQANFGRTGWMYAFEAYGLEPDFVVLGKGLGNGVPVSAAVGRKDVADHLKYGDASDTWSGNPIGCASVIATLDEFESTDILEHTRAMTPIVMEGLNRLKETDLIRNVRGEGMVFGIECEAVGDLTADEVAHHIVEHAYLGEPGGDGVHLLGALAGRVIRISPPLTMTEEQHRTSLELLFRLVQNTAGKLHANPQMAEA